MMPRLTQPNRYEVWPELEIIRLFLGFLLFVFNIFPGLLARRRAQFEIVKLHLDAMGRFFFMNNLYMLRISRAALFYILRVFDGPATVQATYLQGNFRRAKLRVELDRVGLV